MNEQITIGTKGELGAWKIVMPPKDEGQPPITRVVVSSGLLPIVMKYPNTINAEFIDQGECLLDPNEFAPDAKIIEDKPKQDVKLKKRGKNED